jgi:L-aminopeptidase/D-esterase-like protein
MAQTGPRNALTDIAGITVGNAEDEAVRSGVTVIRFEGAMRCAADIRGGGPATRETNAVGAEATLGIAHAITLSGGSVFGLAAADEVAAALSVAGEGFVPVPGTPPVPIIPAASLYDLSNGGAKDWGVEPPYRVLARAALDAASTDAPCGSVGAGYGGRAGQWLGGTGTASIDLGEAGVVAALVAVNSIGSPVMPDGSCLWAWPFERDGEFGGLRPGPETAALDPLPADGKAPLAGTATTIGVVACSRAMSHGMLRRVAIMAQDGLARSIRPSHAPFDGDTIFAVCPIGAAGGAEPSGGEAQLATLIGAAAADCVARAVARGVWHASAETESAKAFRRGSVSG